MEHTVTVSTKGVPDFYRFVFPTAADAAEAIDRLESCMRRRDDSCIRIQDTVLRGEFIQSVHLLPISEQEG